MEPSPTPHWTGPGKGQPCILPRHGENRALDLMGFLGAVSFFLTYCCKPSVHCLSKVVLAELDILVWGGYSLYWGFAQFAYLKDLIAVCVANYDAVSVG